MLEVARVAVEEALALEEVDEHEAVEERRGVPFPLRLIRDAADLAEERLTVVVELTVELLGNLLLVEGPLHLRRNVHDGKRVFLLDGKRELAELLKEALGILTPVPLVLPVSRGLAPRSVHPQPELLRRRPVDEDEEALRGIPRGLPVDLPAHLPRRDETVGVRRDNEHLCPLLLCDGLQRVEVAVHLDPWGALIEMVPADLDKGFGELEFPECAVQAAVGHRGQQSGGGVGRESRITGAGQGGAHGPGGQPPS